MGCTLPVSSDCTTPSVPPRAARVSLAPGRARPRSRITAALAASAVTSASLKAGRCEAPSAISWAARKSRAISGSVRPAMARALAVTFVRGPADDGLEGLGEDVAADLPGLDQGAVDVPEDQAPHALPLGQFGPVGLGPAAAARGQPLVGRDRVQVDAVVEEVREGQQPAVGDTSRPVVWLPPTMASSTLPLAVSMASTEPHSGPGR